MAVGAGGDRTVNPDLPGAEVKPTPTQELLTMKKILIALLICTISMAAAHAGPPADKGNGQKGRGFDWVCFAPFFGQGKWCRKYGNWKP